MAYLVFNPVVGVSATAWPWTGIAASAAGTLPVPAAAVLSAIATNVADAKIDIFIAGIKPALERLIKRSAGDTR